MEKCFDINLGLYYEIQMEIVYYPMRVEIVKCKYKQGLFKNKSDHTIYFILCRK